MIHEAVSCINFHIQYMILKLMTIKQKIYKNQKNPQDKEIFCIGSEIFLQQ